MSWLIRYRRLVRRYDRYTAQFAAFVTIACALICHRKLVKHPKHETRSYGRSDRLAGNEAA